MQDLAYDPATCVTALELRERGMQVPDFIPDEAWLPKAAVHMTLHEGQRVGDKAHIPVTMKLSEPFRWDEVTSE